jgi:protoheme ferro-lyase
LLNCVDKKNEFLNETEQILLGFGRISKINDHIETLETINEICKEFFLNNYCQQVQQFEIIRNLLSESNGKINTKGEE